MSRRVSRATALVAGAVYLFLHLPVLVLVIFRVTASRYSVEWTGFAVERYRLLPGRTDLLRGLRASLSWAPLTRVATVSARCWRWP